MLFGRPKEVARIDRLLTEARSGRGGALVVRGEPGIGKTALLQEARERAHGMVVIETVGVESESELPYAGLSQLLQPLLGHLELLPDRQRAAIRGALGLEIASPGDRFAVYLATLSVLAQAAQGDPVLVLIDDAHWLDRPTAEALAFAARRLHNERVALLLAARDGEMGPRTMREVPELELRGLPLEPAAALLRERTAGVAVAVAEQLHRATAGNPLALIEVGRLLTPAELAGAAPFSDPPPTGPNIERTFGARVAALSESTQRALLIAAADVTVELALLDRALRQEGLDLGALEPAEDARLVDLSGRRVEFAHPLLRSAIYSRASASARRRSHGAVAAALQGSGAQRGRRAWHLAAAVVRASEPVARELNLVAAEALQRAAPATAGWAFEVAARLSPDADARVRRLLAAGRAYHLAAQPDRALRVLEEVLDATEDPLAHADARRLQAQVQTVRGAPREARALLLDQAARVERHDPVRASAMRLEAALSSVELGEPREALRLAEEAWPVAANSGDQLRLFASVVLAGARVLRGDTAAGRPLVEQALAVTQSSELSVFGPPVTLLAFVETWMGEHEQAQRLLIDGVARLRAEGTLSGLPYALAALAQVNITLGEWRAAEAVGRESLMAADELDQRPVIPVPAVLLAFLAGAQGRRTAARAYLKQALSLADELGIESMRTIIGWVSGHLQLTAGAYDEAVAELDRTGRFSLERGLEEPNVASWAQDLAEAYARLRRVREAEDTVELLERQAQRTGGRLAHAGAARCRGLLAGDAEFEVHFARALSWHESTLCPFEQARTQLCFGECLRRAGRRSDAREPLRQALDVFDALGAAPWTERARRELAATGERARRRTPATANQLTPQELQVALLVADGATNREVAGALFVTTKTIETHLSSVYRKLGVRSRVELARQLAASRTVATRVGSAA